MNRTSIKEKVTMTRKSRKKSFVVFAVCALLLGLAAFSGVPKGSSEKKDKASTGDSIFHETMVDMTWQEVEQAAKDGAIILMTTAVVEEHGPHMSCGIDTYLGYLYCKLVRQELESRGIKALIAPPLYWGMNMTTHVFPGTFALRKETMLALMHDIFASLKSWGFTDVFNVNAHMDGLHVLTGLKAVKDAGQTLGINARYAVAEDFLRRFRLEGNEDFVLAYKSPPVDLFAQEYLDLHAGGLETGIVAAFFPDQIDEELTRTLAPTKVTMKDLGKWATDARAVTPLGYLGDPASFNAEEARELVKAECKGIADAIESLLASEK
jgi:creatinine amidohydrolase